MGNDSSDETHFPRIVAWLALAAAVALFLRNTVPALRERAELRARADEFAELRAQYDAAIAHATAAMPGSPGQDLQAVLVAIDRIGWTPAELLHNYPELPASPGADAASGDDAGDEGEPGTASAIPSDQSR